MTVSQNHSPPISLLSRCKSHLSSTVSLKRDGSKSSTCSRPPSSPDDIWGAQLVSRAYRDVPYSPVDPWKPSIVYSIRHINPGITCTPVQTPVNTDDSTFADKQISPPAPGRRFFGSSTVLEYPFSPIDPEHATTEPLKVLPKSIYSQTGVAHEAHSLQHSHCHDEHGKRWSHGSRYLWPYPSPTGLPRSASIASHYSLPNSPSFNDIELRIFSPLSRHFPEPLREPGFVFHSRKTSGSQTLAERINSYPSASISNIHLAPNASDSTTLTLEPHDFHFPPIPILEPPPAPRSRAVVRPQTPQQTPPAKPVEHSNSSSIKSTYPDSFSAKTYIFAFLLDTLPRQIYLYFLLCLPYLYFSRVANIFQAAEISLPKIKQAVIEESRQANRDYGRHSPAHSWAFGPPVAGPAYLNLQKKWELFIDSLLREWKTLNIISVLLLSRDRAILAILQIESAINDPVVVYAALLSMMCGLMSLIYGCIYIIRFGSMRKACKAAMWAAEAQRSTTCILWNVWVLLSMPAAWLAWSLVLYICCIMSLVWRTGSAEDEMTWKLTASQALVPRATITAVLALGVIYFALIMNTLRRYGHTLDRAWKKIATGWVRTKSFKSPAASSSAIHRTITTMRRAPGPSPLSAGPSISAVKSSSSADGRSPSTSEHV